MNKIEYLNALKQALKDIDITVMEEIISDYEEHFQVAMEDGKSQEQICEELGSIDDLVKEINEVYHTDRNNKQAPTGEKSNHQQEHSAKEEYGKQDFSFATDRISNTINQVLDSTSEAVNQALHVTSEVISNVDVKEIRSQLKNSVETVTSRLNDFKNNYGNYPGVFESKNMSAESYQENITKSYDPLELGNQKINLVVDGICADIHVKESTNGKMNIRYENNGNNRQKQKYAFYSFMEGNTVYAGIRIVGNAVFMFNLKVNTITIHIEIPENIGVVDIKTANSDIRIVNVKPECMITKTASGDISFSQVEAKDLQIKSASGDIRIEDSQSVRINAETISGDIEAKNITAKNLSLKSTSGDVNTDNTKADIADCRSLSGSLDIIQLQASECQIKSTSGDIEISNSAINNAEVGSMSGDIRLSNIAGEILSTKSISGDVELDVNTRKCQASSKSGDIESVFNGDVALESTSTSGSIKIRLKNYGNGYRIQSRTVSGNLSVHYNELHQRNLKTGTYTYGSQGSELFLSSISGDIKVSD